MSCSRCSCVESSLVPWPTLPTSGEAKSKDSATDPSCRAAATPSSQLSGSRAAPTGPRAPQLRLDFEGAATSRDQFNVPETERRDSGEWTLLR